MPDPGKTQSFVIEPGGTFSIKNESPSDPVRVRLEVGDFGTVEVELREGSSFKYQAGEQNGKGTVVIGDRPDARASEGGEVIPFDRATRPDASA